MEQGKQMKLNDISYISKVIQNFAVPEPPVAISSCIFPVQVGTDTDITLKYM